MTRAREISNVLGRNIESTTFTATAGQTAFSITHAAGRIQVYMNGLLLDPTVDWTSDGSTVTLTEGAVAGDELEVVKFDNLAVADAIPRTGHTGTIDFSDATFTPPAGHVMQVLQATSNAQQTFSSGSPDNQTFHDISGLSLSITPSATTSKILINASVHVGGKGNAYSPALGIFRGTTKIGAGLESGIDDFGVYTSSRSFGLYESSSQPIVFLDSPSSTSALTYKIRINNNGGGTYPAYVNRAENANDWNGNPLSVLTLWEIAG